MIGFLFYALAAHAYATPAAERNKRPQVDPWVGFFERIGVIPWSGGNGS